MTQSEKIEAWKGLYKNAVKLLEAKERKIKQFKLSEQASNKHINELNDKIFQIKKENNKLKEKVTKAVKALLNE